MRREEKAKLYVTRFYETMRLMRFSYKTIEAYSDWVAQYITFICLPGSGATREERIEKFLTLLVEKKHVSAGTQKQALCAIVKFYKLTLKESVGDLGFAKARRARRLPAVFSREECWGILDKLKGWGWLWGAIMWGCGLRLEELCNLRMKDIDIDRRQLTVREGKGNKDRVLPLPEMLVEPMKLHIKRIVVEHESYAARHIPVWLPDALDRKYPSAPYSLEWFWLFPASGPIKNMSKNPAMRSSTPLLYHIHHSAVQKQIGRAIKAARILKKASCHTLRHSFATHWLENAEGSHEAAILRLQKLMGHKTGDDDDLPAPGQDQVRRAESVGHSPADGGVIWRVAGGKEDGAARKRSSTISAGRRRGRGSCGAIPGSTFTRTPALSALTGMWGIKARGRCSWCEVRHGNYKL